MSHDFFDNFPMTLISQAEQDCAEHDPDMTDAAAMVLVGDVYALLLQNEQPFASDNVLAQTPQTRDDGLSPFIR